MQLSKRTEEPKTTLKEIEDMVGFTLPSDYSMFIQKYFGYEEFIGKEYVRIWDVDELMEQNLGYDIADNLPMTIGIGGNGAGECIAIEMTSTNNYLIVLTHLSTLTNKIILTLDHRSQTF